MRGWRFHVHGSTAVTNILSRERRWRLALAGSSLLAVAVPFLLVRFPPITDLPQHTAQIRLLLDVLRDPGSPYAIQWLTPYGLSYVLLGAAWALAGAANAGRLAFLLLALLWVAAVHALAAGSRRPESQPVLASILVFNHTLYWGFFSFLFGWPVFVLWLHATEPRAVLSLRRSFALAGLAFVLYLTHALWFAFAALWLVVDGLRARLPLRSQLARGATLLPAGALAMWWFVNLQGRGFETGTFWGSSLERLSPATLTNSILGGVTGTLEPIALAFLLGWCALATVQAWSKWRESTDGRLLSLAMMCVVLYIVLPVKFQNTLQFGARWMPYAAVALLLALPAPRFSPLARRVAALLLLTTVCMVTSVYWRTFERVDMAGFEEALEGLPQSPSVIGLSYFEQSPLFKGLPFLQEVAYAQVHHGGTLSFSFADYAPSLVVYQPPRQAGWTPGLRWVPQSVRRSDFAFFDFALINGGEAVHRRFFESVGLVPLTTSGPWRLYRVPHPLVPAPAVAAPPPSPRP